MNDGWRALLIDRLEAIAELLADSGKGLALLALGSAADTDRLDRWSDLDFFAVVEPGSKSAFVDNLDWLAAAHPISWCYRNTKDGWRALFDDQVFAEFVVLEPSDLVHIPFAPGRIIWSRDGFDDSVCVPAITAPPTITDKDWLAGEILSSLMVGLGRWRRGERMAGFRLIQVQAVDHLLNLMALTDGNNAETGPGTDVDPFNPTRRFEARHPLLADLLPTMMAGLDQCPAAARAILVELARRHPIPDSIRDAVLHSTAGE